MRNHQADPLLLRAAEDEARVLVRAGTTEQRTVTRARVILRASAGAGNAAIADELSISPTTVLLWRRRFAKDRLAGLGDAPRADFARN
ncbi:MAG: helix-turn-helix domain-containing protein [Candidatus Limnocylindrales bacterium]